MKVAVFLPNWVGDAVMATPALRALRKRVGGDGRILGVMRPIVAETLAGCPWFDDVLQFDPRSSRRELRGRELLKRLRAESCDVALLLPHSLRVGLLAWSAGIPRRIGFGWLGRRWLLTESLRQPRVGWRTTPAPVLDDYLRLVGTLGCSPEAPYLELATSSDDESAADAAWERLGIERERPLVVFNTGGAYGPAKAWPSEYFAELARRVVQTWHAQVLVLCGPHEREAARAIVAAAGAPGVHSLADERLSIGLSKACVRRASLMVTTDSGPRHFAAAFDVPVVTLFGPTHIAWSETHYPRALHLQENVPCGPCQRRACPLGHHRCMRDLSVERVFAAADALWRAGPQRRAA